MCIKSVFESINSIRHNDIVMKAAPHVYNTIAQKNSSAVRICISLQVTLLLLRLVKYLPVAKPTATSNNEASCACLVLALGRPPHRVSR